MDEGKIALTPAVELSYLTGEEQQALLNEIQYANAVSYTHLDVYKRQGVQPQGWAPFAEGLKGMFTEPVVQKIAAKHGKTVAQVILRWNVQQGVVIIPKSVHKERMEENMAIWDFALDNHCLLYTSRCV